MDTDFSFRKHVKLKKNLPCTSELLASGTYKVMFHHMLLSQGSADLNKIANPPLPPLLFHPLISAWTIDLRFSR